MLEGVNFVTTSADAAGSLWGYAEADPTVVGIVVAAIAAAAVLYVVRRAARRLFGKLTSGRAGDHRGVP